MINDLLIPFLKSIWDLLRDTWIWFLLGFFIAGVVQEFISSKILLKYFGKNDIKSLIRATFSGLFISVCSCGAIPIAAMLRKKGALTATTLTFLLATPWAGFTHLFIISVFIGLKNAIILFILSLNVAFISGIVFSYLENIKWLDQKRKNKHIKEGDCICISCLSKDDLKHKNESLFHRLFYCVPRNIHRTFQDVGKHMLIGMLLAGITKAFIPPSIVSNYLGSKEKVTSIFIAVPISAALNYAQKDLQY